VKCNLIRIIVSSSIVAAILGCATSTSISPESPQYPHLWKATRRENDNSVTTFYLLATSHSASISEYGSYFEKIVLPAFDSSDDLGYEGATRESSNVGIKCTIPLSGDGVGRLNLFRAKVVERLTKLSDLRLSLPNGESENEKAQRYAAIGLRVQMTDEFELAPLYAMSTMALRLSGINLDPVPIEEPMAPIGLPSLPVTVFLAHRRAELVPYNVDRSDGIRRAYCRAGPDRIAFIEQFLTNDKISQPTNDIFVDNLRERKSISPLPAVLNQSFICDRSREWATSIGEQHDGLTHFLILGLAHFYDLADQAHQCAGLLTDLGKVGLQPMLLTQ
jgi:hypothetical protein